MDGTSFEEDVSRSSRVSKSSRLEGRTRLPPFTGCENWEVWLNRFNDVADHRGWSTGQKLDELLPLLLGDTGEFVFGQLTSRVR